MNLAAGAHPAPKGGDLHFLGLKAQGHLRTMQEALYQFSYLIVFPL